MPMPDTGAVLDALVTLAASVTGVQGAVRGFPKSPGPGLRAWVTMAGRGRAGQASDFAAGGLVRRPVRCIVWFSTDFGTSPGTAEATIAGAVDDFEVKSYAARSTNLGGVAESVEFDFTLAENPDYLDFGGTERRTHPVGVAAVQQFIVPI